jgi:5-methylcytosine-specific restriction endonuclease McrA
MPKRPKRSRLSPALYKKLCLQIHTRDHWVCRYCGSRSNLTNHHIIFRSQGGPDTTWNCITLCVDDHNLIHDEKLEILPLHKGEQIDANKGVKWRLKK